MSRILTLSATATVAAPSTAVWAVLADYARDPQWRTGVRSMTVEPAGLVRPGATTDEELHLGGRTYRNLGIVETVDPGHAFTWRTTEGAEAHGRRELRALGPDASEVTMVLHVRPRGFERVLAPVLSRMLLRNLERDLEALGRLVGAASSVEPSRS